jgi:soluble lytic murein transglycosylase
MASALLIPAAPAAAQDPLAPLPAPSTPSTQMILTPRPAPAAPAPQAVAQPVIAQPVITQPVIAQPAITQPQPVIVRVPRDWRGVFDAIQAGDWAGAQAGIATLPADALTPVARAELYTAKGSPAVGVEQIQALLAEAPDLPQAEQLARLAYSRGATNVPYYARNPVILLGSAPQRSRARPVVGDPVADQLRVQLDPLLKGNLAPDAEALLIQALPLLTAEARAEAAQRVAWSYYVLGRDADARRLADSGRVGAYGEWATQAAWTSGLAAWRMNDCEAASRAFREVAGTSRDTELRAGALYWMARAEQACRRPASVEPLLRAAAASPESFYGLVARETLGMDTHLPPDPYSSAAAVEGLPNVRRAVALARIGEPALAEELLKHQARICRPAEHHGLIELAKRLDLAGAQYWLAHFGQPGAVADASDRYPMPRWSPTRGWRIDPALAFAHIRQESQFKANVVSPAGAVGLMQVMPATGAAMAAQNGLPFSRAALVDPAYNMEYGQSFIERMRGSGATQGQLPRVIAAYNAGALPVGRWLFIPDKGDPMLWIESISYWETRYYVPAVLRNLWVYQGLAGSEPPTLKAMAQHRWPAFPTSQTRIASTGQAVTGQGSEPGLAR